MAFKLFKWDPAWFEQADALKHIAPDWETELQKAIVSKPAFVGLTMGCNEDMVTKVRTAIGLTEAGHSIVRTAFNKRWTIIHNNFPDGPSPDGGGRRSHHYIYLKVATQLAYDLGWKLPKPMMRLISPQIKQGMTRSKKDPRSHPQWRRAFEYESEYLNAFYELIERYFFDEEGNPIYDQKKCIRKKNILSDFKSVLNERTLQEADTIITSGKRMGNRKK
jgi:hypothetical protein